jgi:hypothetical protein
MIDKKDTEKLIQKEVEYNFFMKLIILVISLSIVYIYHSVTSITYYLFDNSIPIVSCPKAFINDAPVVMKTLKDGGPMEKDRWIRGFVRRFVLAQFPRTKDDVKKSFLYVKEHSTDSVKYKFEKLFNDAEKIGEAIDNNHYQFYPKTGDSGYEIRIRPGELKDEWYVELDGYIIKKMNNNEERYFPTLKYKIISGKATISNPEGLYVSEANIERIVDYVSVKKENL